MANEINKINEMKLIGLVNLFLGAVLLVVGYPYTMPIILGAVGLICGYIALVGALIIKTINNK